MEKSIIDAIKKHASESNDDSVPAPIYSDEEFEEMLEVIFSYGTPMKFD